jgi:plastocyanin
MKVSKVLFSTVILFTLILASCAAPTTKTQVPSMETSAATDMTSMPTQAPSTNTDTADSSSGSEVVISNFAYAPASLTVKAGTTVTFTNQDSIRHTITSDDGVFDSGLLGKGETFTYTFDKVGIFPYHCTPHPYMKGTIIVE